MNPAVALLSTSLASHSCAATNNSAIKGRIPTGNVHIGYLLFLFTLLLLVFPVRAQYLPPSATDTLNIVEHAGVQKSIYNDIVSTSIPKPGLDTIRGKMSPLHFSTAADSLSKKQVKKRVRLIAAANIIGYSAATIAISQAWYKDYPQSKFHTFNDIGEWQQIDKIGHVYSAYAASKAGMELWRWTGIDRKKQIWIGGLSGFAYQTTIEVMDGFSSEWGWSWGDFAANIAGSGLLVAQELAWDRQRIQMKWSFHRKTYNNPQLNQRSDELFGKSTPERILKDYNGQTYWLSATIKDFFPKTRVPAWLQVSVGTGAEGMFGGYDNIAYDDMGNITFDRRDIKRYRQWYLAPDIDLTRIKTKKKGIRTALYILNIFKFPTPSLELSNGKLGWNWLHF